MNWSEMKTGWQERKDLVKAYWPELSEAVVEKIHGDRIELCRALVHHYGFSEHDAEIAICEFEKDVRRPGAVK